MLTILLIYVKFTIYIETKYLFRNLINQNNVYSTSLYLLEKK
jgi:hypothetical protein